MTTRRIAKTEVASVGLGCMNLSHAYGTPPSAKDAEAMLLGALDLGVNHFDTAALYGFGNNESLLGNVLSSRRDEFFLASKCGMTGVDGTRVIDGRPETLKATCEESLKRLQTDVIDLYYLHRWDKSVPIEDSIGGLAELVSEGKIKAIGLSEVSAETLKRAHAVHPIAAVQTEYSLWTRNPEIAVIEACKDIGAAFVAFSPLARAFLSGNLTDLSSLETKDLRHNLPRFTPENYAKNLLLLEGLPSIAEENNCTMAQLALAWMLAKHDHIIPIPGTTNSQHLVENMAAANVTLDAASIAKLDSLINQETVQGPRYNAATQKEIDTEEFS